MNTVERGGPPIPAESPEALEKARQVDQAIKDTHKLSQSLRGIKFRDPALQEKLRADLSEIAFELQKEQ